MTENPIDWIFFGLTIGAIVGFVAGRWERDRARERNRATLRPFSGPFWLEIDGTPLVVRRIPKRPFDWQTDDPTL